MAADAIAVRLEQARKRPVAARRRDARCNGLRRSRRPDARRDSVARSRSAARRRRRAGRTGSGAGPRLREPTTIPTPASSRRAILRRAVPADQRVNWDRALRPVNRPAKARAAAATATMIQTALDGFPSSHASPRFGQVREQAARRPPDQCPAIDISGLDSRARPQRGAAPPRSGSSAPSVFIASRMRWSTVCGETERARAMSFDVMWRSTILRQARWASVTRARRSSSMPSNPYRPSPAGQGDRRLALALGSR